jgi:hypothetical protein
MKNDAPNAKTSTEQTPHPASGDPVEQRAAEMAKREGDAKVDEGDREDAYEEMQETAPEVPDEAGDDASH